MKLFFSSNLSKVLSGKEFYLDCDFINLIFRNPVAFTELSELFVKGFPLIESSISFEFIRDIFKQNEIDLRTAFLKQDFFFPATNHQQIFSRCQDNALVLSRIYAHSKIQSSKKNTSSVVDLMLAARVMFSREEDPFIITGNKKDYPLCVFDTKAVINVENDKNGEVSSFYILQFNQEKFDLGFSEMQRVH